MDGRLRAVQHAGPRNAALGKVIRTKLAGGQVREAVALPENARNREAWLHVNVVEALNALLVVVAKGPLRANEELAFPPRFEYRWAGAQGKAQRCSALEYADKVLAWASEELARADLAQSKRFERRANKLVTRLFRVYAILFHSRLDAIEAAGAGAHFHAGARHLLFLAFAHGLLEEKECKALPEVCDANRRAFEARGGTVKMWASSADKDGSTPTSFHERRRSEYLDAQATLAKESDVAARLNTLRREASDRSAQIFVDLVEALLREMLEYCDLVWLVHDNYFIPAAELRGMDERVVGQMFVNVGEILRFSELLCLDMHRCVLDDDVRAAPDLSLCISRAVAGSLDFLSIYSRFLASYERAEDTINIQAKEHRDFGELVESNDRELFTMLQSMRRWPATFKVRLATLHTAMPSRTLDALVKQYTQAMRLLDARKEEIANQLLVLDAVCGLEDGAPDLEGALLGSGAAQVKLLQPQQRANGPGTPEWSGMQCFVFAHTLVLAEVSTINQRSLLARMSTSMGSLGKSRGANPRAPGRKQQQRLSSRRQNGRGSKHRPEGAMPPQPPLIGGSSVAQNAQEQQQGGLQKLVLKRQLDLSDCFMTQRQAETASFSPSKGEYSLALCYAPDGRPRDAENAATAPGVMQLLIRTRCGDLTTAMFQALGTSIPDGLFSHIETERLSKERISSRGRLSRQRLSRLLGTGGGGGGGGGGSGGGSGSSGPVLSLPRGFGSSGTSPPHKLHQSQRALDKAETYDFFISHHAGLASDQAISLFLDLRNQGYRVLLDRTTGYSVNTRAVRAQIAHSKVFLLLMTQGALLRRWLQSEVKEARRQNKPIAILYEQPGPPSNNRHKVTWAQAAKSLLVPQEIMDYVQEEIVAVPLQRLGDMREDMWRLVLQSLPLPPQPRPEAGARAHRA